MMLISIQIFETFVRIARLYFRYKKIDGLPSAERWLRFHLVLLPSWGGWIHPIKAWKGHMIQNVF